MSITISRVTSYEVFCEICGEVIHDGANSRFHARDIGDDHMENEHGIYGHHTKEVSEETNNG